MSEGDPEGREFLLIPGSCHGAWCWHRVIPALEALGHRATALDLPGRGAGPIGPAQVTLRDYATAIVGAIRHPTILVAHSAGGYAMAAAAEQDPARITALIYLCAYVPAPGQSLADRRRAGPRQPLSPAIRVAPDRQTYGFDPGQVDALFYHDCPAEDRALAARSLTPEPIAPQETALHPTARSLSLPRHYIICTEDRAIPPEFQRIMAGDLPQSSLPTSHSPFFAAPRALAARLHAIAAGL